MGNKKSAPKVQVTRKQEEVLRNNDNERRLQNGYADIFGFRPNNQGTQLSQVDTLFLNLRGYLVSNLRQLLSQSYAEHGLIQTIVDVPVDDALRGGVEIKTKQLDEDQIHELSTCIEREEDLVCMGQSMKWNRLFGGAGVLIMTDQPYDKPLRPLKEGDRLQFKDADLWELFFTENNVEGDGSPIDDFKSEFYNYYGHKIHRSRVLILKGMKAPSFIRPRLRGWGMSVVEALIRSINQYLKSNNLSFEVLDEFKLDIYMLKNLASTLMGQGGDKIVQDRVALMNQQKNFQNAVVMDSEDKYEQKQLTFSGLGDAMTAIRMQIASDMRMPLTKLFGISAQGFNSGEDDIENYNSMIEGSIRTKCKFHIVKMIELRCEQLFGFIPEDLSIDFKPLRVMSSEQEETVKTSKFSRLLQARMAGLMSIREFKEACNREDLLAIQIDTSQESLEALPTQEGAGETTDDQENPNKTSAKPAAVPKPQSAAKDAPAAKNSLMNSVEYDKRAYETDGGDSQFEPFRPDVLLENPGKVDEGKWEKAKETSQAAFGKMNWKFITWKYKQLGGTFQHQG